MRLEELEGGSAARDGSEDVDEVDEADEGEGDQPQDACTDETKPVQTQATASVPASRRVTPSLRISYPDIMNSTGLSSEAQRMRSTPAPVHPAHLARVRCTAQLFAVDFRASEHIGYLVRASSDETSRADPAARLRQVVQLGVLYHAQVHGYTPG
jgi:hypothetical protein